MTATSADDDAVERPPAGGREVVASPMIPSRSQGVTIMVLDATNDSTNGGQVSFFAESGSGTDAVRQEWESLAPGVLVEWDLGVIEVTEIQGESTVVFTLWDAADLSD